METILWQGNYRDGFLKIVIGTEPDTVGYIFTGQEFFFSNQLSIGGLVGDAIVTHVFAAVAEGWDEGNVKAWKVAKAQDGYVCH